MKSKSFILLMLLIILITFSSIACTNQEGQTKVSPFSGLWEGIDPGDGSLTQRQITCTQDGSCLVLGADSLFSFCETNQGILRGQGTIEGEVLKVPDFTLTCIQDDKEVSVDTTFSLNSSHQTLLEKTVEPSISPITFHKISSVRGKKISWLW